MKRFISALALSAAALMTSTPASAISISFTPASSQIAVGGSVSIEMRISGLGDEILSAFDINLLFDNTVVFNNQVTHNIALQWGPASVFGPSVFNPGNTDVVDYTFDDDATVAAAQANDFLVLTFGFIGMADGFSIIRLGLDPDFERNFVGRDALSLDVDIGTACIAVGTGTCAVPEPGTLALLSLGLLGLGLTRWRRSG